MADILIVDDEVRLRTLLSRTLVAAVTGRSWQRTARRPARWSARARVDLVLLDLVMPGHGRAHRAAPDPDPRRAARPIFVLSGVGDVGTRVQAINEGATDFVTKPFVTAELLARVNRHLGVPRTPPRTAATSSTATSASTPGGGCCTPRRAPPLSERESAVLAYLLRRHGDVCTREELLKDIWGYDFDPGSNVLEVCIGRLRTKILDPAMIETVRGVGYCVADA